MNVMTNNELRPRLDKCLSVEGVTDLFQLMKDWPVSELEGLRDEVDEFFQAGTRAIAEHFSNEAFKPETFLNKKGSEALDEQIQQASLQLLSICSEIESVAQFYLERHGVKIVLPKETA